MHRRSIPRPASSADHVPSCLGRAVALGAVGLLALASGCESAPKSDPVVEATVGGTVTGLAGTGLVLHNSGAGEDLAVSSSGAFAFPTAAALGATYEVTVKTQPSGPTQVCAVTDGTGTGTVANGTTINVIVTCETVAFSVGGTVSGLTGTGLVLQNDLGDDLTVTGNGPFTFTAPILSGAGYAVTVKTHPSGPSQLCTVTSGTGLVGAGHVTSAVVNCQTLALKVGGTVSGLTGTGLVLQNNLGNDLAIAGNGAFNFTNAILSGGSYAVTVKTQPIGQVDSCRVSSGTGSGSVVSSDITSVVVRCGARAWQTAQLIETDNTGGANNPQVAIDGAGNAIAVWYQGTAIWANRYAGNSGWGTAQVIGGGSSPQVASDAAGNAIAVWYQSDGTRTNIWANRYTAGSGWGTAQLIETDNAGGAYGHQVASDAAGNAIAAWYQSDGTRTNIWANRYTAGSGWGTAQLIETDNAGSASDPQVHFDAAGNAIAVWSQSDGALRNIWANRYTAGGVWGTATLIDADPSGDASGPQVALDAAGNGIVVWNRQITSSTSGIWARRRTAAGVWETATLIKTATTRNAGSPQVAFDAAGAAVAVWSVWDGTRYSVWANRCTAGGAWGTDQLIQNTTTSSVGSAQVALDAAGNALAVWSAGADATFSRKDIWANRYVGGSGWETAALIETDDAGNALGPQVHFDSTGNAIAVWYQSDGTRDNIWSSRYE